MVARWRYILPSIVTCVSITTALLAITEAVAGRFDSSAWFILLSVLLDKADGTLARLLQASSRFGVEMDSLSDLIAFGVAPAVLILAALTGHAPITSLAPVPAYRAIVYVGAFLYVIGNALRLAKFNVLTDFYGKEFFFGVPTTVCGGFIAAYFLTVRVYGLPLRFLEVLPGLLIVLSLLMVSRIPLPKVNKRKTMAMNVLQLANVGCIYVCVLLRIVPGYLLAACLAYVVGGAAWALAKGIKPPRPVSTAASPAPDVAPEVEVDSDSERGKDVITP